ncbi:MAG: NAD(P)H-hydrate dehydratase [Polaromonas sp.]|nr:NAD(P)H-hydrate dehydratase [Polaromonas sp.]
MHRIGPDRSHRLDAVAATRAIEQQAASRLPAQALMQRAGLAAARLTLALAPHARRVWVACGPGNNGGDGFEAALQLHLRGVPVRVSWTGPPLGKPHSRDAAAARARALAAGVAVSNAAPGDFDFCIDALLGLGSAFNAERDGQQQIAEWLHAMQNSSAPCLALDLPSGLDADTGVSSATIDPPVAIISGAEYARKIGSKRLFCLSFLTLKPGLFTADGRDRAGEVWFDDLGLESLLQPALPSGEIQAPAGFGAPPPAAWLIGRDRAAPAARSQAAHRSHKGSFGDVAIVGGESDLKRVSHMTGAALLAGRAALHAGAGRVFVALLGPPTLTVDPVQPELMFRSPAALDFSQLSVACGCGGGAAIRAELPRLLSTARQLVVDADALNAIAFDSQLQSLLRSRSKRRAPTVLTPHPLEAARLLGTTAAAVQSDRLAAAAQLAGQFSCVVMLKGSGTVVAAPGEISAINPTGNALLATAGTGDVLAGMLTARLAAQPADSRAAFPVACSTVFEHGLLADRWLQQRPGEPLTASALALGALRDLGE